MKLRNFSFLFIGCCLLTAMVPVSFAAEAPVIDVNVKGVARQSLSLSGVNASGAAGQTFYKTLQNDLFRSGWYRFAQAGQVKVTGSLSGASGVTEALTVAWPGKRFAWNRAAVDTASARRHAHELADAIVNATTGERGIAQSQFAMVYQSGKTRTGQAHRGRLQPQKHAVPVPALAGYFLPCFQGFNCFSKVHVWLLKVEFFERSVH